MSSKYSNVPKGGLALKGGLPGVKKKKKKKKSAAKLDSAPDAIVEQATEAASRGKDTVAQDNTEDGKGGSTLTEEELEARRLKELLDARTPAEKRFAEKAAELELARLRKNKVKSHREKITELNQYLADLSEHHDIPRVGPG
eukprot:TRINITY_DN19487_c0_g1_i1.p1 TRINITY_DN19487_c0_g1~~TRINITY_DN19487_c0_g1_i1.p1  ORF type:complete len:142 (-),score=44.77 TRINITY_DN19487_c0_g1_i1:119-544(-)